MNRRSFLSFLSLSAVASRIAATSTASKDPEWHWDYTETHPEYGPVRRARTIYVSSSRGDDTNDGATPDRPLRTLSTATKKLRHGFPDWIMIERDSKPMSWTDDEILLKPGDCGPTLHGDGEPVVRFFRD